MTAICSAAPPCRRPDELFSQLVRKIVIYEHRGALRELATALGLSYGALYNRLSGRAEFNPREINMLLRELADPRLVDCLLAGSVFVAIRKPENPAPRSGKDVVDIAMSCAVDTLTAVQAIVEAVRGSGLDRERGLEIEGFVSQAQRKLSLLQVVLAECGRVNGPPEAMAPDNEQEGKTVQGRSHRRTEKSGSGSLEPAKNEPPIDEASVRFLASAPGRIQ